MECIRITGHNLQHICRQILICCGWGAISSMFELERPMTPASPISLRSHHCIPFILKLQGALRLRTCKLKKCARALKGLNRRTWRGSLLLFPVDGCLAKEASHKVTSSFLICAMSSCLFPPFQSTRRTKCSVTLVSGSWSWAMYWANEYSGIK